VRSGAGSLPNAGTWHTPAEAATIRLRKQVDDVGLRALVTHGGVHTAGSKPGMEAHFQCRGLDVVPTLANTRGGQTEAITLPSSLGQLSSSGSIAARPQAMKTHRAAFHGNK